MSIIEKDLINAKREIARLTKERDELRAENEKVSRGMAEMTIWWSEAKLAELSQQEPYAIAKGYKLMDSDGKYRLPQDGLKLYSAPIPAAQAVPEGMVRVKQKTLEHIVALAERTDQPKLSMIQIAVIARAMLQASPMEGKETDASS